MRHILLFFAGVLVFTSCVTNKKFTYLQKEDVNPDKDQLPKDSVVRSYEVEPYHYKIQTNDVVSVRFESVTAEEYDFLNNLGGNMMGMVGGGAGSALLVGELVDEEGNIAFPYIGKVKVGGLTIFQIQDTLQSIANKYLQSPIVKARLLNYRITILGEVNKEGTITFGNNRVTMIEALGQAGGLTDLADKANLKLIRQVNGKTEVAYINMLDENFINSPYYYVHQNDVLIAGPLRQRPFRKYFGQNLSLVISSLSLLLITIGLFNSN
jgi:polysaccharide export outer membrane protein